MERSTVPAGTGLRAKMTMSFCASRASMWSAITQKWNARKSNSASASPRTPTICRRPRAKRPSLSQSGPWKEAPCRSMSSSTSSY